MKITELIEQLQEHVDIYGDDEIKSLDVYGNIMETKDFTIDFHKPYTEFIFEVKKK